MKIFDYVCRKLCRICIWYTKYKKQSTKYKIQTTKYKIQLWWWCTLRTPHTNKLNETAAFKEIKGCLWRQLCYKEKTMGCLWRQMCYYFKAKPKKQKKKEIIVTDFWNFKQQKAIANSRILMWNRTTISRERESYH